MIRSALVLMVCTALLIPACSDSDDPKPGPVTPTLSYENLTEKEHVIANLVTSYLERDITGYERILDEDNFTFFFSTGDVVRGLPADGWSKTEDLLATANLLDPNSTAPNRITNIDLYVAQENLTWIPTRPDTLLFPGETWYTTTTLYSFIFQTAHDFTYPSTPGSRAQFVVRNAGTDPAPQWRLVQWMDLGDSGRIRGTSNAVEEATWGRVKSLYTP